MYQNSINATGSLDSYEPIIPKESCNIPLPEMRPVTVDFQKIHSMLSYLSGLDNEVKRLVENIPVEDYKNVTISTIHNTVTVEYRNRTVTVEVYPIVKPDKDERPERIL